MTHRPHAVLSLHLVMTARVPDGNAGAMKAVPLITIPSPRRTQPDAVFMVADSVYLLAGVWKETGYVMV